MNYKKLVLQVEPSLSEEEYTAALAAVSAVPGVYISHYILTDAKGGAHLKVMNVGEDGRVTAVQG